MVKTVVRDAGVTRVARQVFVRDATAVRTLKQIYVRDATGVRLVFSALVAIDGSAFAASGPGKPSTARVNYNADGTITDGGSNVGGGSHNYSGPANWYTPTTAGIGSSYYIRITQDSGDDVFASPTLGTIGSLAAGAYVSISGGAGEDLIGRAKVEIFYDAAGTQLAATGFIDLEATGS